MGRLFDAVAALIGVRQFVNYEAQAAIELEALVDPEENDLYPIDIPEMLSSQGPGIQISQELDPSPMFRAILSDLEDNTPIQIIAARFHNSIAQMVLQTCSYLRDWSGIETVALSGGVWQNMTLLENTYHLLIEHNFSVLIHQQAPPNDGGLALGQVAIAAMTTDRKDRAN